MTNIIPVDLRGLGNLAWPGNLRPLGERTFEKESFQDWWNKNSRQLAHLHPMIAEQWIYRHWDYSPFCNLPINDMRWEQVTWPTEQILRDVSRGDSFSRDVDFNYKTFHGKDTEPGKSMDSTGTWNYPIVVLKVCGPSQTRTGLHDDIRFWLIEGHQRIRYLSALHARQECSASHELFLVTY